MVEEYVLKNVECENNVQNTYCNVHRRWVASSKLSIEVINILLSEANNTLNVSQLQRKGLNMIKMVCDIQ
jgi:hypothetical protein